MDLEMNKFLYLENTYKFDIKNANLLYCANITSAEIIDSKRKQVLSNLDFKIILKFRDDSI